MKEKEIKWLEEQSMLYNAECLAKEYSGNKKQWQRPYAMPQSKEAVEKASAWFTAYPPSTITKEGESMLQALGNEELWSVFEEIGIEAIHTGPMKRSGGVKDGEYTETVDGWFDRITLSIDPHYGTDEQYKELVKTAERHGGIIAGDIIPGHTGKGADFQLALLNYKDYPGIYHLVEIEEDDWALLPDVSAGEDSVNLSEETVNILKDKGYIVGHLQRILFSVPGVTGVTAWDATDIVEGVDAKKRRWVYLHYFKPGQPTMNWLDPTFAANKILAGDIIKTRSMLGATVLRLDANPFLGIEIKENSEKCWSEGHPLSVSATNNIAWQLRKLGGWSFQELNLTIDDVDQFSQYGADLSYDFITRPAYNHALLTGDAGLLKLTLRMMMEYGIQPISLIHALQNHDEITYELVHFERHGSDLFDYKGKKTCGTKLRKLIRCQMEETAIGKKAPYNKLSGNGLCATFTGLCATALGISDIYNLDSEQIAMIKKGHLLMAMYNAMQPGVFACSAWDLVGALPLKESQIEELLADGDSRWVNRGAVDLLNSNLGAKKSSSGLPKAQMLYGPIPEQLKNPVSFVSQLKKMLKIRKQYKIYKAELVELPEVTSDSVVAMLNVLPDDLGKLVVVLNFSPEKINETVRFKTVKNCPTVGLLNPEKLVNDVSISGELSIHLDGFEGRAFLLKP
jgi:trehalose synthase